jgi:hypothetical protein
MPLSYFREIGLLVAGNGRDTGLGVAGLVMGLCHQQNLSGVAVFLQNPEAQFQCTSAHPVTYHNGILHVVTTRARKVDESIWHFGLNVLFQVPPPPRMDLFLIRIFWYLYSIWPKWLVLKVIPTTFFPKHCIAEGCNMPYARIKWRGGRLFFETMTIVHAPSLKPNYTVALAIQASMEIPKVL